jgi:tRNA (guanine37-N1)-methyltransferase
LGRVLPVNKKLTLFKVITLFPEFFSSPLESGLLGKAINAGIIRVEIIDLRTYSEDRLRRCDDYPYGGGSGMVLKPDPLFKAIESNRSGSTIVLHTTPAGTLLNQDLVKMLSRESDICIICGNYEGVDQRVVDRFVDYEISVGDYVLSGGEFASLVIIDAISRFVPGFMSNAASLEDESFEEGLFEYPHYTRPYEIDGLGVPEILMSGNHEMIKKWRLEKSIEKTKRERPELYKRYLYRKMRGEEK